MSYGDNSAEPSPSSADYLESPHEAKRRALKEQLLKKGLKDEATKAGTDLKSLKLALLKGQVDKKDEKNAQQPDEGKKGGSMGTKTREQEIASRKLVADTKHSADQLVDQGEQDEKAEEALKQEEVQSEDA